MGQKNWIRESAIKTLDLADVYDRTKKVNGNIYRDNDSPMVDFKWYAETTPVARSLLLIGEVVVEDMETKYSLSARLPDEVRQRIPSLFKNYGLLFEELERTTDRLVYTQRKKRPSDFATLFSVRSGIVNVDNDDELKIDLTKLRGAGQAVASETALIVNKICESRYSASPTIEITDGKLVAEFWSNLKVHGIDEASEVIESLLLIARDGRTRR